MFLLASSTKEEFTFMDWISQNIIDFTPQHRGVVINVSWGFIAGLGVMFLIVLIARIRSRGKKGP